MNIFKKKIKCTRCGKNYKFKRESNKSVYICSGFANYGKDFCSRDAVDEQDIIDTVSRHLFINREYYLDMGISMNDEIQNYVERIEVGEEGEYRVIYKSGEESIISHNRIKF